MDKLPREILINIFESLNKEDLEEVSKVCRLWKSLVYETPILTHKLHTLICVYDPESDESMLKDNCMRWHINPSPSPHVKDFLDVPYRDIPFDNNYGRHPTKEELIECMDFNHVKKLNGQIYCEMFKFPSVMKNLTHLTLEIYGIKTYDDFEELSLPNLIYLKVCYDIAILYYITDHQIKTLHLQEPKSLVLEETVGIIEDFLESCHELKNLILKEFYKKLENISFNFKLESLECYEVHPDYFPFFIDLMRVYKESLKKFVINFKRFDSKADEIFKYLYFLDEYPSDQLELPLKVDKTVKKIKFQSFQTTKWFKKSKLIFEGCNVLEILLHPETADSVLQVINDTMPNVEHVIIKTMWEWIEVYEVKNSFKIPQVNQLTVKIKSTSSFITKVVSCFTNIKILELQGDKSTITLSDAKILISKCEKIEEIFVRGSLNEEVFDFLLFESSSLKVLKVEVLDPLKYAEVIEKSLKSHVRLTILNQCYKNEENYFDLCENAHRNVKSLLSIECEF